MPLKDLLFEISKPKALLADCATILDICIRSKCSVSIISRYLYMCVGATKGTYCRDIKMIVNHDYIKQCNIFANIFFTDYPSKYCLLSIQLTSAFIYTPQRTNFGCFVCACC